MSYASSAGSRVDQLDDIRERVARLSWLMDSAVRVPGTSFRLGLDSIVGLVPGIGDAATTALSAYLIYEAHRAGVPRSDLMRMIGNVAADSVFGSIPLVGDVFDAVWKANRRNLRILEEHLNRTGKVIEGEVISAR